MKRQLSFLAFAFVLFLCPLFVNAQDTTEKFYSQIDILNDGSIRVRELIELTGEYNGLSRDIVYKNHNLKTFAQEKSDLEGSTIYNGGNITDLKVSSVKIDQFSFEAMEEITKTFSLVSYANKGQSGLYTKNLYDGELSLMVYNPSSLKEAFYIEYRIEDVIVVHNDIAELAWNTLGDGYRENIKDYKVKVNLPSPDSDYRVWLHGPLNGNVERVNDVSSLATYDFLGAHNAVSLRLLFNKELVPYAKKMSGMDAKEDIISYQTSLAEKANREREAIRFQNNVVILLSILWFALSLVVTIRFIRKSKKSKMTTFSSPYYRDFPGEYGPEVLEYLLKQNVDEKSLSATLLLLIDKKVLKVEEVEGKKKDYKLVLQDPLPSLNEIETMTIDLFIGKMGNKKELVLSEIKKYCSNVDHAESFMSGYRSFIKKGIENGKREQFFRQKNRNTLLAAALIFATGTLLTVLACGLEVGFFFPYLSILFGLVFSIILLTRRFYTEKGALHFAQWMAHKRFLQDFGRMDEKELPEVALWDKYLVYAIILDCADELSKQMKLKINTMGDISSGLAYDPYLTHYYLHHSIYTSVNHSVQTAVSSSRSSIAASHASSGSGYGGGSLGGGGSFGGGGGGGRF